MENMRDNVAYYNWLCITRKNSRITQIYAPILNIYEERAQKPTI